MKKLFASFVIALSLFSGLALAQIGISFPGPGMPASGGGGTPMVTPLMFDPNVTGPSTSVASYAGIVGSSSWSTTSPGRDSPVAIAGTIGNLQVRFPAALTGVQTYDIALMKNGSAQTLTCQITLLALTCPDITHTVSVAVGDKLAWRVTPSGTPTTQTNVQISATFTSTTNGESFLIAPSGTPTPSASATNFMPFGSAAGANATEAVVSGVMPTGGVIDNLYFASAAAGAAKSLTVTVMKNGSTTTSTCQITGAGSGSGITFCTDVTHAITYAAGDTISLQVVPAGTPTVGTPSASVRWVPTTPGEAVALSQIPAGAISASTTRFLGLNTFNTSTTETNFYQIAPSIFTVKNLYVQQDVVTGAGAQTRTTTLRAGQPGSVASQSTTCVQNASTPQVNTYFQCQDTTHSYATAVGDMLDWQEVPANTPAAVAYMRFSAVLYTP